MRRLSLVIPCYNEAWNLRQLVGRCDELLANDIEVILVDNGSTDSTPEILGGLSERRSGIRSIRVRRNQGYGFGVLSGLAFAGGEFLAWTHADLQTDPLDALKALDLAEKAKRPARVFVKGRRHGRALRDLAFTWGMSAFETLLLRKPLWDINGQPSLFHRRFLESWREPPYDFSLDLYAYYTAADSGLEIIRFPVAFGDRRAGTGHNDLLPAKIRYSVRTIKFSLSLRHRIGGPGAATRRKTA